MLKNKKNGGRSFGISDNMDHLNWDYHRAPTDIRTRYEECAGTCLLAVGSSACNTLLYFVLPA